MGGRLKRYKTRKERLKQKTSLQNFFGGFWKKEKEKSEVEDLTFTQVKKKTLKQRNK